MKTKVMYPIGGTAPKKVVSYEDANIMREALVKIILYKNLEFNDTINIGLIKNIAISALNQTT